MRWINAQPMGLPGGIMTRSTKRLAMSLAVKPTFQSSSKLAESVTVKPSFHKRPLPTELVALSSKEGKKLFREALAAGGMECYFPLAEQFITQSDPSFCSLSTLAMVMNALNFDLKRVWKGSWRWVTEEMLQCESQGVCGHSIAKVQQSGLSFSEFESLARCHGVKISAQRVSLEDDLGAFRQLVKQVSSSDHASQFLVANFSRQALGQTGDGHYSPIGGYHAERDLVLVLDVARFKYPPYWVPLHSIWGAMGHLDRATNMTRGFFVVSGWEHCGPRCDHSHEHEHTHNKTCPSVIKTWVDHSRSSNNNGSTNNNSTHTHTHAHAHAHTHTSGSNGVSGIQGGRR
ncbi:hypothetical protein EON64_06125 [archaeon]|nr:MAG: hypothetical protein EON64_06125 [archaeon]